MRWRFPSPTDQGEATERARITRSIDAWWAEFVRKAAELQALFSRRVEWDLPAWMQHHLNAIHPQLMWEYGPAVSGGRHRLVITPEARRYLRPMVDEILRRAPRIPGWEFYPYRLPESLQMAQQTVEARTGGDISGCLFSAELGSGNRIHLTSYSPRLSDEDSDRGHFFTATETLLGEEILDKWIGAIDVEPIENGRSGAPLDAVRERVAALIEEARRALPAAPCFEDSADARWTVFELTPDDLQGDYPAQSDMFVGKSTLPEMWKVARSDAAFASERFSRHGETFCYVKLDGRSGLDEEHFADKSEIEDALNAALLPGGLGCHVGGGTGRWYSYIDLALTNVDRGCEIVKTVLRDGNVPKRSWILFFDDEWAHEWIGIYDDSPPPPMAFNRSN